MRLRPGRKIGLFHCPRLSARFVWGKDVQNLRSARIGDLKPHAAIGRNVIRTEKTVKAIARARRNEDPLRKIRIGKILRAIEDDPSRARTRMFLLGVATRMGTLHTNSKPAEATSDRNLR